MTENKIEELCFAGACNRGIAYVGVLQKMIELGVLDKNYLKKIIGVSIGSFISCCFLIGYDPYELLDEIMKADLSEFKDYMITQSSLLKGEKYRDWVFHVISNKIDPNIKLIDLYLLTKINFVIITTCISSENVSIKEGVVYLNYETFPNMPLIDALMANMSFPIVFPYVCYNGCKFIDGGVLKNFPVDLLSKNGIGVKTIFKKHKTDINTPINYILKIIELMSHNLEQQNLNNSGGTIIINCEDFSMLDFDISNDDKYTLFKRGYDSVNEFYESF